MSPWALGAAAIVAIGYTAGVFYTGVDYGDSRASARAKKVDDMVTSAVTAANEASAKAIAQLKITKQTIVQKATREIEIRPEYRDCRHTDGMLATINEALTGKRQKPADSVVPGPTGAPGSLLWGNDANASLRRLPVPGVPISGPGQETTK